MTEGKHRRVNFGFGYGTEEKARAEVDWRHVNFFGGARTAGVLARYSGIDRGVRLNFSSRTSSARRYSLGLQGQYWHNDEPAFTLEDVGGRATVTRAVRRAAAPIRPRRPADDDVVARPTRTSGRTTRSRTRRSPIRRSATS